MLEEKHELSPSRGFHCSQTCENTGVFMLGKFQKHKFFTLQTYIINLQGGNSRVPIIFSSSYVFYIGKRIAERSIQSHL